MTRILALFALALALAACSPVGAVVGVGAVGGTMALEERGFEASARDKLTAATIEAALIDRDLELFRNVGVTVVEDRVFLTGVVADRDQRVDAARIAWAQDNVRDVTNDIRIGAGGDLIDAGRDAGIEARLLSALTFDRDVAAVNYSSQAVDGTVYLFGIAQDQAELDRVRAHARNIAHVRRIVSHVVLKNDPARLAYLAERGRSTGADGETRPDARGAGDGS